MQVVSDCLCLKFRMLARSSTVLYDDELRSTGLSASQFSVLRNIHRFAPQGIARLADVMLKERTTLTRNIDLLAARGLVELERPDHDRRVQRPVLTAGGRAALKAAMPQWRRAQRRVLVGLGSNGWSELKAALQAVAAICEEGPEVKTLSAAEGGAGAGSEPAGFDPASIRRCVNSTLRGASRVVTRQYDDALRPVAMKVTQFHVLAGIEENTGTRITDIASLLLLDQVTATLAVAALRRRGLIEAPKGADRRIALSGKGRRALEAATVRWAECQVRKLDAVAEPGRWTAALDRTLSATLAPLTDVEKSAPPSRGFQPAGLP